MSEKQGDGALLLGIVLLALVLRAWLAWSTPLVGTDAALFLWNAQSWDADGWHAAVRFQKQPLYPFLCWLLAGPCGGVERAGLAVSVLLGSLQVVPVFLLARRLAGRRAAVAAGVLLAVHPHSCRLAGDVMTEGAYYLLLMTALWLGYVAGADRRWRAALLAGLAAGLAYLTRPEGAVVAAVAGVWVFASAAGAWRGAIARAALLAAGFAVAVSPYLLALHADTGRWLLTKKGASIEVDSYMLPRVAGFPREARTSRFEEAAREHGRAAAIFLQLGKMFPTVFKLHALPLLLAFVLRAWRDRALHRFLLAAWVAWAALFFAAFWHLGYLSDRYLLTLVLVGLPWMGSGAAEALGRVGSRSRALAVALAVLFLGGTLVETLKPQRRDQVGQRMAGEWIRDHGGGKGVLVLSPNEKAAWHSGGELRLWSAMRYDELRVRAFPVVRFLTATEEEALAQTPDFPLAGVPGEIERVGEFSAPDGKGKPVVVWEVVRR